MSEPSSAHVPAIDRLKGIAILSVVCIHAKVGEGSLVYEHLVNRAVPIFLILFGVTSELWWRARTAAGSRDVSREWWVGRLRRLVIPLWATGAAWWLCFLVTEDPPLALSWTDALGTVVGFAPFIGTTWFVALALQFVVYFPALRWVAERVPESLLLGAAAIIGGYSVWHMWDIIEWGRFALGGKVAEPGFYYAWIFPPRYFWHVLAGVVLARHTAGVPGRRLTQVSIALASLGVPALVAAGGGDDAFIAGPLRRQIVLHAFDVPLTIALLGILAAVPLPSLITRPLEWCGRGSWGLYLGHALLHEVLHLWGIAPETGPTLVRAIYALMLGGGAIALMFGASIAERVIRTAWFPPTTPGGGRAAAGSAERPS